MAERLKQNKKSAMAFYDKNTLMAYLNSATVSHYRRARKGGKMALNRQSLA